MQHEPALPDESVKNQDLGAGGDRGLPIEINFSDETKRAISSKDYLGKVVLINFWASWCEPCVEEMPTFKTLEKKVNSKDLVILLINMDEEQEAVEIVNKIWGAQGFSFAKLFDFKKSSLEKLGIETLPSTYILDKQGRVAMTGTGANDWGHDNFVHSVQELLAEGH